jgi:hypothetical protein
MIVVKKATKFPLIVSNPAVPRHEIWFIDSKNVIHKITNVDAAKFKRSCRKCIEQIHVGKDACGYCGYVFPRPEAVQ